jgi:hypothetical protein
MRLEYNLVPFRDKVQATIRRGKLTVDLLESEGATPQRVSQEMEYIRKELLDLRIRTVQDFQDHLTEIIEA